MDIATERSSINDVPIENDSDFVIERKIFRDISDGNSEPDSLRLIDVYDFLRNFALRLRSEFLLPTLFTVDCAFLEQFFESDSEVFLYCCGDKMCNADSLMEKLASAELVSTIFVSIKLCREFLVSCERHDTDQGRSECLRADDFARIVTLFNRTLSIPEPRPSVDVCKRSAPWRQVATESVISSDVSDSCPDSSDVYSPDASQSVAGEG